MSCKTVQHREILALLVSAAAGVLSASSASAQDAAAKPTAPAHSAPIEVAEPADYKLTDYRSPVPKALAGARVVDAKGADGLLAGGKAIFIDVYPRAPKPAGLPANTIWRSPKHASIKGSYWLPNVGYGKLAAEPEAYFKNNLERLTDGAKDKTLVFFCLRDCWMSWNAAKRALSWGYADVVWFPDGADGWQEIGHEIVHIEPEVGGG